MGLFLGMSLLTIVEVLMFLAKISWIAVSKKRRNYLAEKKKREEEKEKELEKTMEDWKKSNSQLQRLSQHLAAVEAESLKPPPKKTSIQWLMDKMPHRRNRLGSSEDSTSNFVNRRAVSADSPPPVPKKSRQEFMNHFYNSKLHGNGTVEDDGGSLVNPRHKQSVVSSISNDMFRLNLKLISKTWKSSW